MLRVEGVLHPVFGRHLAIYQSSALQMFHLTTSHSSAMNSLQRVCWSWLEKWKKSEWLPAADRTPSISLKPSDGKLEHSQHVGQFKQVRRTLGLGHYTCILYNRFFFACVPLADTKWQKRVNNLLMHWYVTEVPPREITTDGCCFPLRSRIIYSHTSHSDTFHLLHTWQRTPSVPNSLLKSFLR